jgi:hypothetical protein
MNFMPSQTIFAPRHGIVRRKSRRPAAAARMGRTEPPSATAVSRYGARDPRAQLRVCIPCRQKFFSLHIGNRICKKCKQTNQLECA